MTRPYPPEPWQLRGDMHVALWLVPGDDLPHWPLPDGVHAVSPAGRRRLLVTFWVDYRSGGDLAYRELLVAIVVRRAARLAATAVQVWVDDERSLAGGRQLWAIPKERAAFDFRPLPLTRHRAGGLRAAMTTEGPAQGEPDASVLCHDLLRLPVRLPVRAHLLQRRGDGTACDVPLRLAGRPSLGRTRLRVRPDGPLAYLSGHKPVASVSLRDFRFTVGSA
ncbi:acetoacetate decarboxylase family protein [Streptomyces bungoensis]